MSKIVCRPCGFAHDGPCRKQARYVEVGLVDGKVSVIPAKDSVAAVRRCMECAVKDAKIRALESLLEKLESNPPIIKGTTLTVSNGAFDKKAYQREYMKQRRAKQKANHV